MSLLRFTAAPPPSSNTPDPTIILLLLKPRHHLSRFSLSRTLTFFPPNTISYSRPNYGNKPGFLPRKFGNFHVKCISSFNPAHSLDWNDPLSASEVVAGENWVVVEDEDEVDSGDSIPVRAYFFSTSVDVKRLVDQKKANFIPLSSPMKNYVVFRSSNPSSADVLIRRLSSSPISGVGSDCCYMVVFQYGSIVLFNVPEHEVDGYLKIVEKHSWGLLPELRKDEYEVKEKPTSSTWMRGGLDYIMLKYLNINGIRTIGSVLGQSFALDYYVRQVDGMVAEFTDINRGREKTGTFETDRKKLFQLVGKASSNLADVILKLGLCERSDIAWKNAEYTHIWEYLRDESELTQRFASLDFKLKFWSITSGFSKKSFRTGSQIS